MSQDSYSVFRVKGDYKAEMTHQLKPKKSTFHS